MVPRKIHSTLSRAFLPSSWKLQKNHVAGSHIFSVYNEIFFEFGNKQKKTQSHELSSGIFCFLQKMEENNQLLRPSFSLPSHLDDIFCNVQSWKRKWPDWCGFRRFRRLFSFRYKSNKIPHSTKISNTERKEQESLSWALK